MSLSQLVLDAIDRLKQYNLGIYNAVSNRFGLGGVGGMNANWSRHSKDIATACEAVGTLTEASAASESNAATSAEAAANSAQSAQQNAQATAADRQVTGQDRQATAADRQAVAQDRVAVEGSASAAAGSATLAGQYAAAAGGSIPSLRLTWDTATSDADPGNGRVRLNSPTPAAATALYVDNLDVAGASITAVLDRWTASTNTVKGTLRIAHRTDATKWVEYLVTGNVVDGTGYRKVTVTGGTGPGGFAAGDPVAVGFSRAGDAPSSFGAGTLAAPGWAVTGDSNTGLAQVGGADTLSVVAGGTETLRLVGSVNAVNFLYIGNTATGVRVALQARGTDTNVGASVDTKGSGDVLFSSQQYGSINFQIGGGTVNAINYFAVAGAAAGNGPYLTASGSETNVSANYKTKGTGSHYFMGGDGAVQVQIVPVSGSTRAVTFSGSNGANPKLGTTGGAIQLDTASVSKVVNLGNVSGTVALDWSQTNRFDGTLVGNLTLANPTGMTVGQVVEFHPKQDGTGNRTLALGSYFRTVGNAGIVLSTTPNARDKIIMECYSATEIDIRIAKDWRNA